METGTPEEQNSLLQRHKLIMLDILSAVDEVCTRHGIPYWLEGGTLLGAVRHEGFIPWDDDLDIQVLSRDYKKLLRLLSSELDERYVVQTHRTDKNYFLLHAKVRDTRSRLTENRETDKNFKYRGIYIDIFPVTRANRFLVKLSASIHARMTFLISPIKNDKFGMLFTLKNILFYLLLCFYAILRVINKLLFPKYINFDFGTYFRLNCKPEEIFPLSKIEFEGRMFNAPNNYDAILSRTFGNYMELPPEDKRVAHTQHLEIL